MRSLVRVAALLLALAVVISACGGDDDESAGSSGGKSAEDASSAEVEKWQTDLNAVGCYAGPVDGTSGPQTEAAIRAFQAASGLEVDGLLGPNTEEALEEAVAAGETVCTNDGDTGGSGATATLSSANYGPKEFVIGSCSSSGESDIDLQAEADNLTLLVEASAMEGSLSVDGGTESDGVTLEGTVDSVVVGDTGDFTVKGTFEAPTNEGEAFTLVGSCA